ncbi:MAG: hypothetical protein ABIU86_15145 [Gemmatimonadaceae bacterium]
MKARSSDLRRSAEEISDLYIEFDGQQLAVGTDVPEMREFLADAYSAMLVPVQREGVGRLEFVRRGSGFEVRGGRERELAAPLRFLFESIRAEVLYCFITARRDLMWMHAGAAERAGRAVIFAGPSGNGKSTMVTLLCELGWRFLSDDIAPIRMNADEVLPFPESPRRRIHPGEVFPPERLALLDRESVVIEAELIREEAAPIGGIVFPVFRGGATAGLERVTAGEAALKLIRDCTNFADHKAAAVARAAALAQTIPVYELTYSSGRDAQALLNSRL